MFQSYHSVDVLGAATDPTSAMDKGEVYVIQLGCEQFSNFESVYVSLFSHNGTYR